MSKIQEKLAELKSKIQSLDGISVDVSTKEEFVAFYKQYWPQIKDVLVFVKERKVTRKRADNKIQKVIDAGDQVYATLNDPAKLSAALDNFGDMIDNIEDKLDKAISVLSFVERLFKEERKFDDLLDKTIEVLTKISDILEDLSEKVDDLNGK